MSKRLQSVDRALRILLLFQSEGEEVSVSEIAAALGVHKSTASRLAATLRAHELLERVPGSERFRLGPELARLGMLALRGRDLIDVSRAPMEKLAADTGETVTLAVPHAGELATVAQIDSAYVVGSQSWLGRRTPLHCTSDGKVLLAFADAELPAGRLRALTGATITSRRTLARELEDVRTRGWALARSELEDGLNGVAAPVLDPYGRCVAALSVSGPSYRVPGASPAALGTRCLHAADAISRALGSSRDGAGSAPAA